LTAGRWPWKLETAKQCVTTDPPNSVALKMDEARRGRLRQQRGEGGKGRSFF